MKTFCTIITADHFPKAIVLYNSLRKFDPGVMLVVLIVDDVNAIPSTIPLPGIRIMSLPDVSGSILLESLYRQYAHVNTDLFRWALKPIFILCLLNEFQQVICVDCDLFFVNDYTFLFKELEDSSVILTPHWRNIDPLFDETTFVSTFTDGIFNAGFIGVNTNGREALNWWAEACHFKMGELKILGIQDDQKYLDIFPVYFEKTKIIRHRGCNVATWNTDECKRTLVNGELLINEKFPIIFIHFNHVLIKEILKGHDDLLLPYFHLYEKMFQEAGFELSAFLKDIDYYVDASFLLRLKWRVKLRTRIKRFFYRLAEKL